MIIRSRAIRCLSTEVWPWSNPHLPCRVNKTITGQDLDAHIGHLRRQFPHNLAGRHVVVCVAPGPWHVASRWAIWRSGGAIVPVHDKCPEHQLLQIIKQSRASCAIVDQAKSSLCQAIAGQIPVIYSDFNGNSAHPDEYPTVAITDDTIAQILFTSGTTGAPKAVCLSHGNIQAQVRSLTEAWQLSAHDHILHCLPLHHIHGTINALECPLWNGASVTFVPKFDANLVWDHFLTDKTINVFMGVPTMYSMLIDAYDRMNSAEQERCRSACRRFRLMISGSAALHVSILQRWASISGYILLERYGMTETGMILSNPYVGERRPGYVGRALPGVEVKLINQGNYGDEESGEICVRGPGVFSCYLDDPIATSAAFDSDGFFKTGDIGCRDGSDYRILGRASTDILKTAGYKVSCLDIENEILSCQGVKECSVVGLEHIVFGDVIAAVVVGDITVPFLKEWLRTRLPPYKLPRRIRVVDTIPKNAMGKTDKKAVKLLIGSK